MNIFQPWTTTDGTLIHDHCVTNDAGETTVYFKKTLNLAQSKAFVAYTNAKIASLQAYDAKAEVAKVEAANTAQIADLQEKIAPVEEKVTALEAVKAEITP